MSAAVFPPPLLTRLVDWPDALLACPVYWDPMPTVAASSRLRVANYEGRELGQAAHMRGEWDRRADGRSVSVPMNEIMRAGSATTRAT